MLTSIIFPFIFETEVRVMSNVAVYPSPVSSSKKGRVRRQLGGCPDRIGGDGSGLVLGA